MKNWIKISMILCTFGFFREFRPSEPFVTEFLSGEWRNVTSDQVNRYVYPWGTYSYLTQLIIAFLITDMLRYKPVIVVSAFCGIIIWSLLLWTFTIEGLQVTQVFYGTFMASEVAYYTYIFAKVDKSKYQKVTGHTRSAILMGRFGGSLLAQLLVTFDQMNFRELNYISFVSQCVSLIWAFLLPSVSTSQYFYTKPDQLKLEQFAMTEGHINQAVDIEKDFVQNNNAIKNEVETITTQHKTNILTTETKAVFSCSRAMSLLWIHFKTSYSNKIVIQWSFWWALAMCGFLQVQTYVQLLWQQIDPHRENLYNGGVEAALTLLGAVGAFSAGFLESKKFDRLDLWIITTCSILEGGFLLWGSLTENVWISYVMYVCFGTLYHFMITVASATVAKNIIDDSFALIFGINTFIALGFQSALTVIVVSENGFALSTRGQFIVYGVYFIVLGAIYCITGLVGLLLKKKLP